MAAFPDVTLSTPYIAQTEYKSDLVDVLQIEGIADKLFVDLAQELVAFKSTEPLNPSDLGMRVRRFVRKGIDFVRFVVAL